MRTSLILPILVGLGLLTACTVDDSTSPIRNSSDSGKGGSTAGSAGSKPATGGSAGSGLTTGTSGSSGSSGTSGAAGTAGAGGAGGATDDASVDSGSVDDGSTGSDGFDGHFVYPEASTCAGYALQFDGNAMNASVTRMVQDDFTLEAWFKTSATLTGANFWDGAGLIYADIGGNNDDFGTSILNDKLAFGMGNISTEAGPLTELTVQSTATVTTGQWIHLAVTRNKTSGLVQIFLNGLLDTSTVFENHNSLTAQANITIGGNTVDGRFFTGTMDDVRIWSVVRTQGEIAANMHHVLVGNEAGLAGYWRFDIAGATDALDSHGLNNATFSNTPPNWVPSDAPICDKPTEAGSAVTDAAPDGG